MNLKTVERIIESAKQGDERPFDKFLKNTFNLLQPKLLTYTKSKEDVEEIFIISMQKFWERFVINQEKLPYNSMAYIYTMCKNAWLMQKRNSWNSIIRSDKLNTHNNDSTIESFSNKEEHQDDFLDSDEYFLKHKALSLALDVLSPNCKTLMEVELDNTIKLKPLQKELGYKNYQALVQAKYNCKKRLISKVYEIMYKLRKKQIG